jgi:hypothetical protein
VQKLKRVLVRFGVLVLIALAVCGFAFFIGIPSLILISSSRSVSAALDGARAVTVTEMVPYFEASSSDQIVQRERILQTVTATPEQVARFREATGGFLAVGFPLAHARCFDPHHRVDVIRADGSLFRFDVCFLCGNVQFGGPAIQTIPPRWVPRLRQFFSELGMPPRTAEEYAKLAPQGLFGN